MQKNPVNSTAASAPAALRAPRTAKRSPTRSPAPWGPHERLELSRHLRRDLRARVSDRWGRGLRLPPVRRCARQVPGRRLRSLPRAGVRMKLTNRLGLPEPIVAAVANDGYSRGDADISVTSLLKPP